MMCESSSHVIVVSGVSGRWSSQDGIRLVDYSSGVAWQIVQTMA